MSTSFRRMHAFKIIAHQLWEDEFIDHSQAELPLSDVCLLQHLLLLSSTRDMAKSNTLAEP